MAINLGAAAVKVAVALVAAGIMASLCLFAQAQGTGEGFMSILSGPMSEEQPQAQVGNKPGAATPAFGSLIGQEFTLVARNPNLELYMNMGDSRLIVRDLRCGKLWRSSPEVGDRPLKGGTLWRQHMNSTFVITYTDERKRSTKITNNIREAAAIAWEPIPSGMRAHYNIPKLGVSLTIEYRLGDDYLEVRIPGHEIQESGEFKLVTLEPLPFFGATLNDIDGYVLVPDRSGGLMYFRDRPSEPRRAFYETVYGRDWINKNIFTPLTHVSMPVFGVAHHGGEDASFLAVVTRGDLEASIIASPAGYITDFNRASVEFRMRRPYSAPISAGVFVDTFTEDLIRGDRAVRYMFQAGPDATYSGMAAAYRRHLIAERGLTKNVADAARLQLRIFQGIEKKRGMFSRFIPMTTFHEARTILDALLKAGVAKFDVTLVGWGKDGYDGASPLRLPPDKRLGGEGGLKKLVSHAKANGIRVFLEDNYLDAFKGNRGFSARRDVMRGVDKLPRFIEPDNFFLSPEAGLRIASRDIPKIAKYDVDGLDLRYIGQVPMSDTNRKYSAGRHETTAKWLRIMDLTRDTFGSVGSIGSNMYVVGRVDRIMNAPMEDSEYEFVDESIPFYQMVIHGLVTYSGYPGNLRSDPDVEFLKMVECGAVPSFELTYRHSSELKETTYNMLFSSFYKDWADVVAREWRAVCEEMGDLQSKFITAHRILGPGLRETEYEDGTRVIVNYNTSGAQVAGLTSRVKARSYVVVRKGGTAR
ncbi:MAG: DUF5696 domain-containing protein [Bacillota bacterium]